MNLLKAMFTVSGMTFLSRILGFARESLIARYFGSGLETDAWNVAFRLPNLLRRIFAEGAFSQAFVPMLAEYKHQKGEDATRDFVSHVHGTLALALFVITAIGIVAAPLVIMITAPGFDRNAGQFHLAQQLLKITFPYILLISLSSLGSGVLNTYSKFSIPAFSPALLNLSFIATIIWLAPHLHQPIFALAIATFIGGVAQLVFQWPYLAQIGMLTWPRLNLRDEAVWRVIRKMGPGVFAGSVSQISLVINTMYASSLVVGSVSALNYADRLMELPTGLLGAALGTILLPALSKHHSNKSPLEYSALLDWGMRMALMLAVPAAAALAVIGGPLTVAMYEYGKFHADAAAMTERALVAYAVGLPGLILLKVLAPAFYARQNMKTPVKVAFVTLIATQLLNLVLVSRLQHAGLALSISLAALLNSAMLLTLLRRQGIYQPAAGWLRFGLQIGTGVLTMSVALWAMTHFWQGWAHGRMIWRMLNLAPVIFGGIAVYFGALWLCGLRLKDFMRREH